MTFVNQNCLKFEHQNTKNPLRIFCYINKSELILNRAGGNFTTTLTLMSPWEMWSPRLIRFCLFTKSPFFMKAFAVVFDAFVPASQASVLPLSFTENHFMASVDMKINLNFFETVANLLSSVFKGFFWRKRSIKNYISFSLKSLTKKKIWVKDFKDKEI